MTGVVGNIEKRGHPEMRKARRNTVRIAIFGTVLVGVLHAPGRRSQNISGRRKISGLARIERAAQPDRRSWKPPPAHIAGLFQSFGLKPVDGKNYELAFPAEIGAKTRHAQRIFVHRRWRKTDAQARPGFSSRFSFFDRRNGLGWRGVLPATASLPSRIATTITRTST